MARYLTTLGNRLSSLINPIHVVRVGMWFRIKTHLLKSCVRNDVRTTTPIHHQLPLIYDIGVSLSKSNTYEFKFNKKKIVFEPA